MTGRHRGGGLDLVQRASDGVADLGDQPQRPGQEFAGHGDGGEAFGFP